MATLPPSTYIQGWTPGVAGDSTHVGVGNVGGLPIAPTGPAFNILSYGGDNTGTSDNGTALTNTASAAFAGGGHVYLPAGTFRFDNQIQQGMPIYGAGMDQTILDIRASVSTAIAYGIGTSFSNPGNPDDIITAGLTTGSTSVTITGNTNDFAVGYQIGIFISDDVDEALIEAGTVPMMLRPGSPPGFSRTHVAKVTNVNSGTKTITFDRPIFFPIQAATTGYVRAGQLAWGPSGIANVTIDGTNSVSTFLIIFANIYGGFMYRTKVKKGNAYSVYLDVTSGFEMRECVIEDAKAPGGTNQSGLLMHKSTGALIENNAFYSLNPGMEINFSTCGSVFAYNYFDKATSNINHGATNSYNLYEGNIATQVKSDGYFGGSLYDCIFRNWLTGRDSRINTAGIIGVLELKRLAYKASVVANYYGTLNSAITATSVYENWGTPNIGNNTSYGNVDAAAGDWWVAWNEAAALPMTWSGTVASGGGTTAGVLTMAIMSGAKGFIAQAENAQGEIVLTWSGGAAYATPTQGSESGSNYSISNVGARGNPGFSAVLPADGTAITVVTNTSSFQEKDDGVYNSSYRKRNYYLSSNPGVTGWVSGEENIGSDTVPESLFRTSKPDWFGSLPWPAFDTSREAEPSYTDLPAAYRYINGNSNYLPGNYPGNWTVNGALTCATLSLSG